LCLASTISPMSSLIQTASSKCFGGFCKTFRHASLKTKTDMTFSMFFPRECEEQGRVPVVFFLSGLTCTDQNALTKGHFQQHAATRGICLVFPDTSPRGHPSIPGEGDSFDFGLGASFYLTATTEAFREHYNMHDYLVDELPALLTREFPTQLDLSKRSIMGHSMGGHGALVLCLRNPELFKTVSAFAPVCNPVNSPWGRKALTGFLGSDEQEWTRWDASELLKQFSAPLSILVDQGAEDEFLKKQQLRPDALVQAAVGNEHVRLKLRMQAGYDHSYFFVQSFAKDHIDFHADVLKAVE
jgi:S-formylglutathione hydrolase